jgi:PAS domain S-box-containing protein
LGTTFDDEALAALRRSEELYARAFLQNPVAMTITNAVTGRFTAVNEEFLRLVGYWRAEVIGRTSAELKLWPEYGDRARVGEMLEAGDTPGPVDGGVRTKAGTIVRCKAWFRQLATSEGPTVLTVLVTDAPAD